MKNRSNSFTLFAIISSVVLLLVLQIIWLSMEYKDELSRFRRDSHMIFRNTILELNDSLVQKNIIAIGRSEFRHASNDSLQLGQNNRVIKVWVDSLSSGHVYQSSGRTLVEDSSAQKGIMFRFRIDSSERDFIYKKYIEQLNLAGLTLPVELIFLNDLPSSPRGPLIMTEEIVHTPSGTFKLEFDDLNWFILKNIVPQISFALILTILIVGSFVLVYRNLLLQQRLVIIKDGLISNISHELKTPITTASVALEGLRNFKGQNDPVASSEYLAIAEHELKRLSLLTDKVLRTSLEANDKSPEHIVSFDFRELLTEVIQSFTLIVEKKGATITFDLVEGDFIVEGDRDHLSNILFNLLDNALKYSIQTATINVELKDLKDHLLISIRDNGIGIPKTYQSKIFERFFRVPTGDLHSVKGYGLGLSYVKQVIDNHRGEVSVESEPNNGSTFIVRLPKIHAKK